MKSIENESRLIDYLYDELPEGDARLFQTELEASPQRAEEISSYTRLLEIYRHETEEISPSTDTTEAILAEARRATQPWYARLFGGWRPSALLRPSVAVAAVAVLVVGMGVFFFHSGRTDSEESGSEPTMVAAAHESESRASRPEEALADPSDGAPGLLAAAEKARRASGEVGEESDRESALAALGGKDEAANEQGRAGERSGMDGDNDGTPAPLSEGRGESQQKGGQRGRDELLSADAPVGDSVQLRRGTGGGYVSVQEQTPKRSLSAAAPAPPQSMSADVQSRVEPSKPAPKAEALLDRVTTGAGSPGGRAPQTAQSAPAAQRALGALPEDKRDSEKAEEHSQTRKQQVPPTTQSAPVLYNQATTTLNRGRIAEACGMFESLVRTHRDSPRRPDALLGWARCEMARGAFGRAETIIQTLIKDHPDWRKSGETWHAEIQRQRQQAVLRAQRASAAARRKAAAPVKARPQPSQSATPSQ